MELGSVWAVCQVKQLEDMEKLTGEEESEEEWQKSEGRKRKGRPKRKGKADVIRLGTASWEKIWGDEHRWQEEGSKAIGMVEEGKCKIGMTFQVCEVVKALAAVSKMEENGNRVVFEQGGGYIEHIETGKKVKMRKKGGSYVLDVTLRGSGPVEVTVDSGAEESVCPAWWGEEFKTKRTEKEMKLINASGKPIAHFGEREVTMEAKVS